MTIVVIELHPAHGPGLLGEVLESRGRAVRLVTRHDGVALPGLDEIRALAVLGGADADAEVRALAAACVDADVPVLATGLGASALLPGVTAAEPALGGVSPTADAAKDDVFEGLDADTRFLVTATFDPAAAGLVVARMADTPVAVRLGERAYALAFEPERGVSLDPPPEDDAEAAAAHARRERYLRPHAIALLGRWVDAVVGRTEAEAPWGRSGPPPEARPGLYLNPA